MRRGPLDEHVQAAAVQGRAVVLQVVAGVAVAVADRLPDVRRLVRLHAAAAHRRGSISPLTNSALSRSCSASSRNRGPRASSRFSGSFAQLRGVCRASRRKRVRHHEQLHELSSCPSRSSRILGRQPVEQFGVARRLALRAEVVARLHQADAEELLPEPVDRDAGRQRVLGRHEPVRQVEPRRAARRARRLAAAAAPPGVPGSTFSPGLSYWPRIITNASRGTRQVAEDHRAGDARRRPLRGRPGPSPTRPARGEFVVQRAGRRTRGRTPAASRPLPARCVLLRAAGRDRVQLGGQFRRRLAAERSSTTRGTMPAGRSPARVSPLERERVPVHDAAVLLEA